MVAFFIIYKVDFFSMFYDLKVTYRNLELYYHEDFYMSTYSPKVMKISTILRTVPTYALDWATIVAHIPWISQWFLHALIRNCYNKLAIHTHQDIYNSRILVCCRLALLSIYFNLLMPHYPDIPLLIRHPPCYF